MQIKKKLKKVVSQMIRGFRKAKGASEEMAATSTSRVNFMLCMQITCKTQSI
jgi:hypothetical protein